MALVCTVHTYNSYSCMEEGQSLNKGERTSYEHSVYSVRESKSIGQTCKCKNCEYIHDRTHVGDETRARQGLA